MAQIFIQVQNIMKVSGMQTSGVDGVECTMLMVLCMRENGLMI